MLVYLIKTGHYRFLKFFSRLPKWQAYINFKKANLGLHISIIVWKRTRGLEKITMQSICKGMVGSRCIYFNSSAIIISTR
jgi:hypothetical protein